MKANKKKKYPSYAEYRKRFLREEDSLPYDDPQMLGQILADKHAEMIKEVVRQWAKDSVQSGSEIKGKRKSQPKNPPKS